MNDTTSSEEQISYLMKPILEVLQAAGGQLERSEIRDRISELPTSRLHPKVKCGLTIWWVAKEKWKLKQDSGILNKLTTLLQQN